MSEKKITLSIRSEMQQVELLGKAVQCLCRELPLANTSVNQVELAVVESVNNCIEHAYSGQMGFRIDLELEINSAHLAIYIRDHGIPMAAEVVSELVDAEVHMPSLDGDFQLLPESGWGMQLVKSICDSISYNRKCSCNTIGLCFELRKLAA